MAISGFQVSKHKWALTGSLWSTQCFKISMCKRSEDGNKPTHWSLIMEMSLVEHSSSSFNDQGNNNMSSIGNAIRVIMAAGEPAMEGSYLIAALPPL